MPEWSLAYKLLLHQVEVPPLRPSVAQCMARMAACARPALSSGPARATFRHRRQRSTAAMRPAANPTRTVVHKYIVGLLPSLVQPGSNSH